MVAGHLREGLNRLPLVLLLAAFSLPLFFGLGRTDLENDEAIYSYAVESILTTGEWASPRASPEPNRIFLEKPPLKFWIVAAPMRLGLLPGSEFGMRFWDAMCGGLAFFYVFLIGRRLAGPVCGVVAVLVLFAHDRLLFDHGLRSNNMDAALFLSYCGGIYHYLAWSAAKRRRMLHLAAFAALFYLGFMTKFVAALFLPVVVGASAVFLPSHRAQMLAHWRAWFVAAAAVLAAILPWFLYQHVQHGDTFWQVIVGEHVYTRFTRYIDPSHVAPWHFYLTEAWRQFSRTGSAPWVAFGLVTFVIQTARRPVPERLTVLMWFVIPVTLISLGTSKLYHYFYPYLPPLALAAGYGVSWLVSLFPSGGAVRQSAGAPIAPWRRTVFVPLTVLALAVAVLTAIEPLRLQVAGFTFLTNHSLARPLVVAAICGTLAGWWRFALGGIVVLAASLIIPSPIDGYAASLERLAERRQPLQALGACLRDVDRARHAAGKPVMEPYAPLNDSFLHPYFYYLRGSGWFQEVDDKILYDALFSPGRERPVLIGAADYAEFLARPGLPATLPHGISRPELVVLLPGDYVQCRLATGMGTI